MKKKVAFVIPYFGQFPNYFQLFLDSCSFNPEFEWLIFSDDTSLYNYPSNVHFIKMSFGECRDLIQSKFDFKVKLHKPQKLCDYKCAYGYIFSDYLNEYTWWGHCDLDQIFGDIKFFITDDMLNKYDKIGSIGHLTLYRNTSENNIVFMNTQRYREVFTTEVGCGFDEWLPGNINELYLQSKQLVYYDNLGADLNPYMTTFETVHFDIKNRCYIRSDIHNSIFYIRKGHVYQLYFIGSKIQEREYPYVHLQKRKMKDCRSCNSGDYYIVPNRFVDVPNRPHNLIRKANIFQLFNFQFFRVKMNSLKYRIKNSDWQFTSTFK